MKLALKSIRSRLTLWFALSLAVILGLYSVGLYVFLRHNLVGELDRKLWKDVETIQEALQDLPEQDGKLDFSKYFDPANHDVKERWLLEVWTTSGEKAFSNPARPDDPLGRTSPSDCPARRVEAKTVSLTDGLQLRALCSKVEVGRHSLFIRVARSAERVLHELAELLWIMGLGVPLAILLAALGGYWLARKSLLPVKQMTEQAKRIHADRLSDRLPVANPDDELGLLAGTFNQTFERLEKSFEQMRRFTADASHELRTPLTAIRTMGEVSLRENRPAESYRETLSSVLEETDRLRNLVDSLLTLSRADAGQIKIKRKPEDLSLVLSEVLEHLGVLAEEKNQKLHSRLAENVTANIDRGVFKQALINLVENAIKYSPAGKTIDIQLARYGSEAVVSIQDEGPGIALEHQSKVFERFYRIDSGRAREEGGTGLGLSIAQWAVQANSGRIELASELGKGSRFSIHLPI
jgi:heavy metal sensor kinase